MIEAIARPRLSPNERRTLGLLFRNEVATQGVIADALDLTQQSTSRIVARLADAGLVWVGQRINAGRRGYPTASLRLVGGYSHSLGVSLMADGVALTVTDMTGATIAYERQSLPKPSIASVLGWCEAAVARLARSIDGDLRAVGVGVAVAGSFIAEGGFNTPWQLDEWAGRDVAALFAEALGLPAVVDNDGNLATLAENARGVGRRYRSFAYLYVGAGLGGGLVLNGELWRGRYGNAGEYAGGLPNESYPIPNLEILRQLLARDGIVFDTVTAMLDAFDPAWPALDEWCLRVADSFSIIASNATAILDLEAIVLGGRMPRALAERLIDRIEFFDQRRRGIPRPIAKLVPAEYAGDAAGAGAALLPIHQTFF